MQKNYPSYYMPYKDEEPEETDSDDTGSETSLENTAGPDFPTFQRQLQFQQTESQGEYEPLNKPYLPVFYIKNQTYPQTSLLALRSNNRDTSTYPFPVYFSMKTPRVYKNISKIKCVQIIFPDITRGVLGESPHATSSIVDLLSTTTAKYNLSTTIGLYAGCVDQTSATHSFSINENVDISGQSVNNIVSIEHRDTYDTKGLINRLNEASNNTPPFNLISYTDFSNNFATTCSITSLFNQPGLYFYDSLCKSYKKSPTQDDIITTYYPSIYSTFDTYTQNDLLVAYYYPPLREAVINPIHRQFIDISGSTLPNSDALLPAVVNTFQGYSNNILYNLCSTNRVFLDKYRDKYTFKYNLLNEYTWDYDCNRDRIKLNICKLHSTICADIDDASAFWNSEISTSHITINAAIFNTTSTIYGKYGNIIPNIYYDSSSVSLNCDSATGPITLNMYGGDNQHVFRQTSPFLPPNSTCINIANIIAGNYASLQQNFMNTLTLQMGFPLSTVSVSFQASAPCPPFPRHDLFLQLNTEKTMNRMDVIADDEKKVNSTDNVINYLQQSTINSLTVVPPFTTVDYSLQTIVSVPFSTINYNTTISQGETNIVLGKLVFSDDYPYVCKTFSQTFIQNPVLFQPSLGKLDRISFNFLLDEGLVPIASILPSYAQIDNWRGVFQVDEQIPFVKPTHVPNVPLSERKPPT